MVSTRQMTIGNNGAGESNQSTSEGPAKFTRNSTSTTTTLAGCSSSMQYSRVPSSPVQSTYLLDLPQEIIEKIFSYLRFKNICQLRLVCRTINRICEQILNSHFLRLQNQMLQRFQEIKAKMPRRESARRSHHLACESDIIETLHMRLTLLQMSFGKHIERKHCCFFPGDILDEVNDILHYIKVTPKLDLPYKVTDEMFDLSTMAMEYFKEKIEPNLPEIAYFSSDFLSFPGRFTNSSSLLAETSKDSGHASTDEIESGEDMVETIPQSNMVLRKRIRKIKQGMKRYNSQLSLLRQDLRSCKKKTSDQQKQISEQQKQLADQQKQTLEYATRLDDYDKKNEEISRTLLQELNKCKTELQYWRCRSPTTPPFCNNCGNAIGPQPEEIQALMNQGVNPEGLGIEVISDSGNLEHPECSKAIDEDLKATEKKYVTIDQPSTSVDTLPSKTKRKVDEEIEEQPIKKTRRFSKIRSKRSAKVRDPTRGIWNYLKKFIERFIRFIFQNLTH
ncbi:F-box only protein 28 isoform X2 [Diorhabda sublineata]|uniref:F-box only protein 28 isoform X2 n=2 Tax=Diorhabda TaxID=217246 RepID=UPI0024E126C9|nr:F-box only protein 28 isoform X2 [Diorhabda sublineata]